MQQIPRRTPLIKRDFEKATMHGHPAVNLYLSEHVFIRTPLEDFFQHNKRNDVNMSMNRKSFFISASYSVAPSGRHKWFIAARRYNTSRFSEVK